MDVTFSSLEAAEAYALEMRSESLSCVPFLFDLYF